VGDGLGQHDGFRESLRPDAYGGWFLGKDLRYNGQAG
jgi:hypothetical protein